MFIKIPPNFRNSGHLYVNFLSLHFFLTKKKHLSTPLPPSAVTLSLAHPPTVCLDPKCQQFCLKVIETHDSWQIGRATRNDIQIALYNCIIHKENAGTLGWYPSCFSPPRSPLEGGIPNKYPLYKVYMGLIIKGPPSQGYHHFPYE